MLTAHCATDAHMDFMLTPPKRVPQQAALILICGILEDDKIIISAEQLVRNFLVESVLPLHQHDAKVAKESLLKVISLFAVAKQSAAVNRVTSGCEAESSPAKMAKCRSIARYPSGKEIPAYKQSV